MPMWRYRVRCAILFLVIAVIPARADDLTDFNTLMEGVTSHIRVALGYLRTGNTDLSSLEIDRTREAWGKLQQHFGGRRPKMFETSPLYKNIVTGVAARLVGAELLLNAGRPDAAMDSLNKLRGEFYDLRKASGIVVLADCVRDANTAMDALMVYNDRALDFGKPETNADLRAKTAAYGDTLKRCDSIADEKVRAEPEFRRLVDGAQASLTLIPKAIETHDADLLHRVLIELRSFDNLLAFRFG
jgi:hypothetical protein